MCSLPPSVCILLSICISFPPDLCSSFWLCLSNRRALCYERGAALERWFAADSPWMPGRTVITSEIFMEKAGKRTPAANRLEFANVCILRDNSQGPQVKKRVKRLPSINKRSELLRSHTVWQIQQFSAHFFLHSFQICKIHLKVQAPQLDVLFRLRLLNAAYRLSKILLPPTDQVYSFYIDRSHELYSPQHPTINSCLLD